MLPENQKDKDYKLIRNVSFISTVFNEEASISSFLNSFFKQNYLPEEIIFVDGGSKDKTVELLSDFFLRKINSDFGFEVIEVYKDGLRKNTKDIKIIGSYEIIKSKYKEKDGIVLSVILIQKNNANISEGRNIAINYSKNETICVSDAGCMLDKNWVYEITKYVLSGCNESQGLISYDAAGGYSRPVATTLLEKILSTCIMPQLKELKADKFMPSSRNISFKKAAWEKVGGYPVNMDYGEDMKFDFNLKKEGFKIKFNPNAVVKWKMRENIILIFKQFFRYAKGDAIGRMYFHRHIIRFFSVLVFFMILIVSIIISPWLLLVFIPFFLGYVYKPYSRLGRTFENEKNNMKIFFKKIAVILSIPLMLIYIDIAKIFGYIYGLIKE